MWTQTTPFAPPGTKINLEEGAAFTPNFDAQGLIAAIAVEAQTGAVLMLAWMNAQALARTLETGDVWYYSRSRQKLWRKGETSGHTQRLVAMHTDCDQDALVLHIAQQGPACHTQRQSCFYRKVVLDETGPRLHILQDPIPQDPTPIERAE